MKDKYNSLVEYILNNQSKFYRLAFTYIRNEEEALDIVQNAILKALENYNSIKNINAIKTWFYKVLVNESLSYIKKKKNELPSDDNILDGIYLEKNFDQESDLYENLKLLPLQTQTIIMLHYFEDLSLSDISKITNTNLNTVKSRLYSGLKKLRVNLEEE